MAVPPSRSSGEMLTERLATLAAGVSAGLSEIGHSVEALAAELAPLRQLVPATTTTDADPGVIDAIRKASHAPTCEHVSTFGIPTWSIPWIGVPKTIGQSDELFQLVPVPNEHVVAVYRLLADLAEG